MFCKNQSSTKILLVKTCPVVCVDIWWWATTDGLKRIGRNVEMRDVSMWLVCWCVTAMEHAGIPTKQAVCVLLNSSGQSDESCSLQLLWSNDGWQAADLSFLSLLSFLCSILPSQLQTPHPPVSCLLILARTSLCSSLFWLSLCFLWFILHSLCHSKGGVIYQISPGSRRAWCRTIPWSSGRPLERRF